MFDCLKVRENECEKEIMISVDAVCVLTNKHIRKHLSNVRFKPLFGW